jgi:hypothetical protein
MQSIINVEPSKLYAFNLEMVNSSRMDISQYFKIVDSKFYLQAENESSSKDSSDLGWTSSQDHDILDTKERTGGSSKDSSDLGLMLDQDRDILDTKKNKNDSSKDSSDLGRTSDQDRDILDTKESKVKDSSDRGRTSDRDHDILDTKKNKNGSSKDSSDLCGTFHKDRDILDTKERNEFIDYFVRLVKTPFDFCVSHDEFQKYGVVNQTKHVVDLLMTANDFVEGVDFIIQTKIVNKGKRGQKEKLTYLMRPKVFKACLIRSKNTKRYLNYYLQLEDILVFYQDYQERYQANVLNGKDDKIDEQSKDIKELKNDIKEQNRKAEERDRLNNEKFNKLLERTGATLDELEEIKEICQDTGIQIGEVVEAIEVINDKIDKTCKDNVRPALKNVEEKTEFVLIQSKMKPTEFKFLRGKKAYNDKALRRMFDGDYSLIKREFDANPMTLFNEIKIYISDELKKVKKSLNTKGMDATQRQQARLALEKVRIKNIDIELCNGFTPDDFNLLIDRVIQEKFVVFEETIVLMDAKKGVVKNVIGKLTNTKK